MEPLVTAAFEIAPANVPVVNPSVEEETSVVVAVKGALKLTSGSTIVILPPVKFKLEVSILKIEPPKPTLVATFPLSLPSTIISPPV